MLVGDSVFSSKGTGQRGTPIGIDGTGDSTAVPRWERWEIQFNATGKQDYARQLDFFGIELAVFGGGENTIESASNLASVPTRHINLEPESEKRLYFSWKRFNPLVRFDRQLLSAAGIASSGLIVVRLTPSSLEQQLVQLERQHCQVNGKGFPDAIAKTVFQSQPDGDGFQFEVVSQRYR